MERFLVYLMSGRVLHINDWTSMDAARQANVWHQYTDAIERIERVKMKSPLCGEPRIVKVERRPPPSYAVPQK